MSTNSRKELKKTKTPGPMLKNSSVMVQIFFREASLRQNSVSSTRHLITRATYCQPSKMHHLANNSLAMSHFAKKRHFVKCVAKGNATLVKWRIDQVTLFWQSDTFRPCDILPSDVLAKRRVEMTSVWRSEASYGLEILIFHFSKRRKTN